MVETSRPLPHSTAARPARGTAPAVAERSGSARTAPATRLLAADAAGTRATARAAGAREPVDVFRAHHFAGLGCRSHLG